MRHIKYPADVLDYVVEVDLADGDNVNGVSVAVSPAGLTVDSTSYTLTTATAWLAGGTLGVRYKVTYTITTAMGRTAQAEKWITIARAPSLRRLKQPADVEAYTFDFNDAEHPWIPNGDTISSSTVTASAGVTLGQKLATSSTVTQWVSGGTNGNQYTVTCLIVTAGGRTKEVDLVLQVVDQ